MPRKRGGMNFDGLQMPRTKNLRYRAYSLEIEFFEFFLELEIENLCIRWKFAPNTAYDGNCTQKPGAENMLSWKRGSK